MAQITLAARIRHKKGKGAVRRLRKNNEIPAIFYGPGTNPIMLAVSYSDLQEIMKKSAGENIILGLQIESESGSDMRTVMLKELQADPIKDHFLHADFYEVSMDKEITVNIPIHLVNTPTGVTKGGILQLVRRELSISCLPDKLIDRLEVDVSHLDIGETVHIRDIKHPEGITPLDEDHLAVAVVAAPTIEVEEAEEEVVEEAVEEETVETEPQDG